MQGTRRPLVAGNWKMNGTLAEARQRASALKGGLPLSGCDVLVAPPFLHIPAVVAAFDGSGVAVAGQDVSPNDKGAFTGDVSAAMLLDAGCTFVIVGHSERRVLRGDTDAVVVSKTKAALAAGLQPVVCVGESLDEREAGQTAVVVLRQLEAVLGGLGVDGASRLVLAYEPVWAIGTGRQATPLQAQEVHALLRAQVALRDPVAASAVRILYGGSVNAANAAELFAMPDVDGVLVGGASLDANEFLKICAAAR